MSADFEPTGEFVPVDAELRGASLGTRVQQLLDERSGEFAVLGLGLSGESVAKLLQSHGVLVYASDIGKSEAVEAAATRLNAAGIAADVGKHDVKRIGHAVCVVVSPGIPPGVPPLKAAHEAHIPVVSEVEIGLRLLRNAQYIAVTGTNGKTTTTSLIAHLLQALGRRAVEAGNIGTPVSQIALEASARELIAPEADNPQWIALELSSFQLHDTPAVKPMVGVLTNLTPDHLDRYNNSTSAYYADKALLFSNGDNESCWVVPAEGTEALEMTEQLPGRTLRFSTLRNDVDAHFDRASGQMVVMGHTIAPRASLPLAGDHNVANMLAALLAVMAAHPSHATPEARALLAEAFRTVKALPHRIEPVADVDDVLWLNDSKATNVSSTLVAIAGMTRPTVLLLGGRHKGEPYTALAEPLLKTGRAIIAYGEAAALIRDDLEPLLTDRVPMYFMPSAPFAEIMDRARAVAQAGDAVLLSPACSSYDMFNNYKERGVAFGALARGETTGGQK